MKRNGFVLFRLGALLVAACLLGACAARNEGATQPPITEVPTHTPADGAAYSDTLSVLFVNVGKADAAIVQYRGATALIDTGTKASAPRLFAALNALGVESIDAVVLTHTHSDHVGGLTALANNYDVGVVLSPVYSEQNSSGTHKNQAKCQKLGLPYVELGAGGSYSVSDALSFYALGPLVRNAEDDNDNSLVLMLACNQRRILFAGDMQFAEEGTLLKAGADLRADVLKVGNHGNPDATGEDFAKAVSPSMAIISTDTAEDADSANQRVIDALSAAEVFVTQDYALGALLSVAADGSMQLSDPVRLRSQGGAQLCVQTADAQEQTIVLCNDGDQSVDLSGFALYCDPSDAIVRFPSGTVLAARDTLRVTAEGGGGDVVFSGEKKPLSVKKQNKVYLYDAYGNLLDSFS